MPPHTTENDTAESAQLHGRAIEVFPGGVSHNVRYREPHPIYVDRAEGARMWDVDGNEYVDFWNNHAASILGHAPPEVVSAIEEQATDGIHYGAPNELALELGRAIWEFVPSAERVRFCVSGTEATMYAVRLARAWTGRDRIVKIEGGWHGGNTDLAHAVHPPFDAPTTVGLPPGAGRSVHAVPLNDGDALLSVLEEYGEEVAAVIVDPRRGGIPPDERYLELLCDARDDVGFQLIFDEVVTGFRVSPGSYQARVGVRPDLTTLGKILGGGLPIGAVVGSADLFEAARPDRAVDPNDRVLAGGGTFSMHPLVSRTGLATLETLGSEPVYEHTESLADRLRRELRATFAEHDVDAEVLGLSSLVRIAFEPERELASPTDVKAATDTALLLRFYEELRTRGYYFNPGSMGNLSYRVTGSHVDGLVDAAGDAIRKMRDDGVL